MKCQHLVTGGDGMPRPCTVPATYTIRTEPDREAFQHVCTMHAKKVAAKMDRSLWSVQRDRDGEPL